jgi:hypothetical protein
VKIPGASCGKVFKGRQAQKLKPQEGTQKVKTEKRLQREGPQLGGNAQGQEVQLKLMHARNMKARKAG